MATESSDKSKYHQPESALAGISDSILHGLTTPVELFTHSADQKQNQKTTKDLADFRENSRDYLKEGLKTAAMFMRGKTGLISTIATQALDEWKPEDKQHQLLDLSLGATKGAALTYIFRKTAMVDSNIKFFGGALNIPYNAAKLGFLSRIPSVGLTRSTWVDENDKFDANRSGSIWAASTASIGTDIFAGVATHGLLKCTNRVTGNAVAKSPMLSTVLTGSGFGMSNGAAQEVFRQTEELQQFDPLKLDYWKIGQSALLQGAIDSIAAIPGGRQAEHEALLSYNKMNAGPPVKKVPSFKRTIERSTELEPGNDTSKHDSCSMCLTKTDLGSIAIKPILNESTIGKFSRFDKQIQSKRFMQVYDLKTNDVLQQMSDFVVYMPKDHNLIIGVPTEYNNILNYMRELRIIRESGGEASLFGFNYRYDHLDLMIRRMNERALPEDLIPCLDALPNSQLIESIYLHDERSPQDLKAGPGKFGYAIADANSEGHLNYYMHPDRPALLRLNTNHEFAHLVHFKFEDAYVAYASACALEKALSKQGENARDYATKNEYENFAVHFGEELLDPSPDKLLSAAEYAPVRLAILAKALKATLTAIPQAKVSLHRNQFLKRADLLEEKHTSQVIDDLMNSIAARDINEDPMLHNHRLQVLAYLGGPKQAQKLVNLAKYATDPIPLLDAGYRMCRTDRNKQLDFLLKMSESTPYETVRDLAIGKFDEAEIKSHFIPYIARLSTKSKPLYVRRLNDLSKWHETNNNPEKREHYARMALQESMESPNSETLVALDILIDCLMDKREYGQVEKYMRDSTTLSKLLYGEVSNETRYNLDRLGGFLLTEERYKEALPFLVRCQQIEKTQKYSLQEGAWQNRKYQLQDIISIYETPEFDKHTNGLIFWLKQLDKHINYHGEYELQQQVVDRLLDLLPPSQSQEYIDKLLFLNKVKAKMKPSEEPVNAI